MIIHLIIGLIKKALLHCMKMSQYFSKPFRSFRGNINVKVNFCNLTNLKTVDKLDIDKLVPLPVDMSK